jgi:hypothetical protein
MTVIVPTVEDQPAEELPVNEQSTAVAVDAPAVEACREAVDVEVVRLGQRVRAIERRPTRTVRTSCSNCC